MVKVCVVFGCTNRDNKTADKSFHAFPLSRPDICQKWIRNVNRKDEKSGKLWQPTKHSRICSDHFLPGDYEIDTAIKLLRQNAIPSVFPNHPPNQQPKVQRKRSSPKKRVCPSPKKRCINLSQPSTSSTAHVDRNYTSSVEAEFEKIKIILQKKDEQLNEKNKEIKSLNQKLRRRDEKISKLLSLMKSSNIISQEQHDLLESNFDSDTYTLIENELKSLNTNQHGMMYSEELKRFAVTLHFYSSQAYDYVVRQFLTLPHPSAIQKWARSQNCNPGFLSEVLNTLETTVTPNIKDVVVMFDSMHLKKGYFYDSSSKSYIGSVNLGNLSVDDDDTQAGQVLVVMVVGLKKHFKQPIGYFLISKITAQTQAQIVKDSLFMLSGAGYTVHAVVCDGCYTNQATATTLGCDLNPLDMKNTFQHPVTSEPVFFIFDACHLMKNVRNCLGDMKTLHYQDEEIRWDYIVQLDKIQRDDNLVLANKIRGKHMNYHKNKMNVKFAVQTISASVANAIDFLREDLSLPQFHGSEPTTTFLKVFDKLFDFCNSSSPLGKYLKSPMTKTNISSREKQINEAIQYIICLKDHTGKLMIHGKRKTGFVGFICTLQLQSIIGLCKKLLTGLDYKFVMTYRLSQDHLETFFSRIRRKNGWNNNPTPAQFKWALRALLMKNGVLPSKNANCVLIEEPTNDMITTEEEKATCKELQHLVQVLEKPSVFFKHSLYYISGYISRKIAEITKCSKCTQALLTKNNDSPYSAFTKTSSRGGLIMSDDMFAVIKEADQNLRQILTTKGVIKGVDHHLVSKVTSSVLASVSTKVFQDIWTHSKETHNLETEDNHVFQVIKEACKIFCNTIIHHHERLISDRYIFKDGGTQRHHLNKTVLFLHQ